MAILLEMVFESVPKTNVIQLMQFLISASGRITATQCTEDIKLMNGDKLNEHSISSLLNFDGNVSALVNLEEMDLGSVALKNILLRLVKYEEYYDIDLSFDPEEVEDIDMTAIVIELHRFATGIARNYNTAKFFCGLDPAADENTRYFTNDVLGPLINT